MDNVEITGNVNFKFDLEVRSVENFAVGALVALATDLSGLPVPIRCQWKRIVEDREYIVSDGTSNAYQPSCEDIGTYISVMATPIEFGDFSGEIEAKYGPVQLEASLTKTLEYILMSGGSKFSVRHISDTTPTGNDSVLQVSPTSLSIQFLAGTGTADEFKSNFTINYPKIIINPQNTKRITFLFTEDSKFEKLEHGVMGYDKTISVECLSRHSRDLIVLTIRAYAVRNYLINSNAFNLLFHQEHKSRLKKTEFYIASLTSELSRTREEIFKAIQSFDTIEREKTRSTNELETLELEMCDMIATYQEMVEMTHKDHGEERIMQIKHELDIWVVGMKKLRKKHAELNEECRVLKKRAPEEEPPTDLEARLAQLEEIHEQATQEAQLAHNEHMEELRAQIKTVQEESADLLTAQEEHEKKRRLYEKKMFEQGQHLKAARQENEALQGQTKILTQKREKTDQELVDVQDELVKLKEDYNNLLERNSKQQPEENKQDLENDNLRKAVELAKKELQMAKGKCASFSAKMSRLQAAARRKNKAFTK